MQTLPNNSLLRDAYLADIENNSTNTGTQSWNSAIKSIWEELEITTPTHSIHAKVMKEHHNKLKKNYEEMFFQELKSATGISGKGGNKLRTYNIIKKEYCLENYLSLTSNPNIRRLITKLRISDHNLRIETGRREKDMPQEKRICLICNNNQVENEMHFLLACKTQCSKLPAFSRFLARIIPKKRTICTRLRFQERTLFQITFMNQKLFL